MKIKKEGKLHWRLMSKDYTELAYWMLGIRGLQLEIEFPSDWHERARGWVRICLGFFTLCFSFPWKWTVPDHYQCSGPRYGFTFYEDIFWIHYGKSKGTRDDPTISLYMPWHWRHISTVTTSSTTEHLYNYILKSGEVQLRLATIYSERRKWWRMWLPFRVVRNSISIEFNKEVGERTGSWKGGCTGCSYDLLYGESNWQALRRMEKERKF